MTFKVTCKTLFASLTLLTGIFSANAKTNADSKIVAKPKFIESSTNKEPFANLLAPNKEAHKYYLSVSNAKYNASAKSIQMISRFFMDDMEDVLNARNSNPIVLGDPAQLADLQPLLQRYIQKKLKVQVDGTSRTPNLIGAEYESDQIILYIEIPSENPPKELSMSFTALFELFTEQKNLVHLKMNGVRKTLLMNNNKAIDSVKF